MNQPQPLTDQSLELMLGNLLRWGVILSAIVVLAGGALYLAQHGMDQPDYRKFHGTPSELTSVPGIVREAAALHSRGMIQLGLLLLVLTPVARVVLSAVGFLLERDWMYLAITLIVMAVLFYSLIRIH
jgi:uncharacterized membrane protein